jgi:hypothetical protein
MIRATFLGLLFTTFLFTSSLFAQDNAAPSAGAPGCGAPDTKFDVKTAEGQHPAQPEAGKALVYFIQDDSAYISRPRPTTRMGVDGEWVGATHSNSYFYFSVNPGLHHLCASWQGDGQKAAAAHFTAEAGGVYYFEVKNSYWTNGSTGMSLDPVDSDEGQLLVNQFSFNISHPKK